MFILKLIIRNSFRHPLRAILTVAGVAVAIIAFGLLRTLIELWYAGADHASSSRLITRNSISLIFPLPISYKDRIRQTPGVKQVSWGNWFGGMYIDEKHFFANYAVEPEGYLDLYPEFRVPNEQRKAFLSDRKACIVGRRLADLYGWKLGDNITLKGTIFPGQWSFVLRAIYDGAEKATEERLLMFHWDYLNETLKKTVPRRADQPGYFVIGLKRPEEAAEVSAAVDERFKNSIAETLTETEKAFHLSFVAMTEAILVAIKAVSYVVIVIIMVVAANTMAMTARERISEYATLKALGFRGYHIAGAVFGESLFISLLGGTVGVLLTFPAAKWIESALVQFFPVFNVTGTTIMLDFAAAAVVGTAAGIFPTWRGSTINVADGLRRIG